MRVGGEVPFRGRERCLPTGVPRFVIYSRVAPFYFIQTPQMVTIINAVGPEVRRVYLNVFQFRRAMSSIPDF